MNRIAKIAVDLPLGEGVIAIASKKIEISLDCPDCQRKRRTVVFQEGESHGVCTPTGHWFRGVVLSKRQQEERGLFAVEYEVEYQYEPFIDGKYPDRLPYYGPSEGIPTWARVSFIITCPRCQATVARSTQTNLVRPHTEKCGCGHDLLTHDAPPSLSWRNDGAA